MEEDNARERQLIKEMRTERYIKVASKARQRRERIPKVDMDQNPFCADRQLADEYQLQNLNRVSHFEQPPDATLTHTIEPEVLYVQDVNVTKTIGQLPQLLLCKSFKYLA